MIPASTSSWLYLAIFLLTVVGSFVPVDGIKTVAMILAVAFAIREFARTPRVPRTVGAVLTVAGAGVGWYAGAPVDVVVGGIGRTLPFFVLFAAVICLQAAADRSASLSAAREYAAGQGPGRRFLLVSAACHYLGSVLNLAGVSLFSLVVVREDDPARRKRMTMALLQGFTAASFWSPFFVAVPVILGVIPGVRWIDIAFFGLLGGAVLIINGWLLEVLFRPRGAPEPVDREPVILPASAKKGLATIFLSLFVIVVGLVEGFHLSIPIVLGLVAPPYALIWCLAGKGNRASPHAITASGFVVRVFKGLPNLRGEIAIFLSANIFGAGVAAAIQPEAVARLVESLSLPADAKVLLVVAIFMICGAMGLHPVIVVMIVGHVLPPEVIGIPPRFMVLLLLSLWGLSTTVSPFGASVLLMSRISKTSGFIIAWRWNVAYGLSGAVFATLFVIGLSRWLG
jgi:hypothetical protein